MNDPAFQLRPASVEDYDFLYALQRATYRDYVIQTWGRWDEAWQQDYFRSHFDPAQEQIIVVDGQDAGALSVDRRPDELFLANIQILPAYQNRGLGTALIRQLLTEAQARGVPLALHVLRVNPARWLYERLGFRVVEETPTHFVMRAP
jgi:ribosomal protein S18 acetylase RimI-like enzyme